MADVFHLSSWSAISSVLNRDDHRVTMETPLSFISTTCVHEGSISHEQVSEAKAIKWTKLYAKS